MRGERMEIEDEIEDEIDDEIEDEIVGCSRR